MKRILKNKASVNTDRRYNAALGQLAEIIHRLPKHHRDEILSGLHCLQVTIPGADSKQDLEYLGALAFILKLSLEILKFSDRERALQTDPAFAQNRYFTQSFKTYPNGENEPAELISNSSNITPSGNEPKPAEEREDEKTARGLNDIPPGNGPETGNEQQDEHN